MIPGYPVGPDTEEAVLDAVRQVWRSGPHHSLCLELGIASWEGLWASFEGCHERLEALRAWIPTYRTQAWQRVLGLFGVKDTELVGLVDDTYRACQGGGHRLVEGADELVRSLAGRRPLGLLNQWPP